MRDYGERLAGDGRRMSLEVLLDKQLAMLSHTQNLLEQCLAEFDPAKGHRPGTDMIKQLDVISTAITKIVSAKVTLNKRLKELGDAMTSDELDKAAVERIQDMPYQRRVQVIYNLTKFTSREGGYAPSKYKGSIEALQAAMDAGEVPTPEDITGGE